MMTMDAWTLDLADEELDLPGWRFLPTDLQAAERRQWIAESVADLEGSPGWDEEVVSGEQARSLLEQALTQRELSDSLAMVQVWPPFAGHTAMCHVNILPSEAMPAWAELDDAVVHATDAPHLGPGVEVITSRAVEGLDDVELTGVHFVFDDGATTVMVSLDETLTPLIAIVLPGLVALVRHLRVVNETDGTAFHAVAPAGLTVEGPWDFQAEG